MSNGLPTGLPPGVNLITDEELTMLVQQAVTQEMQDLTETIREDVIRRIGGEMREQIRGGVERSITGTLDEDLGEVDRRVDRMVKEEVGAVLHEIIHGPEFHVAMVTSTHAVLGGLVLAASPWLAETVAGMLTEYIAGAKVERILGKLLENSPERKEVASTLLTTARDIVFNTSAEMAIKASEIQNEALALKSDADLLEQRASEIAAEGSEMSLKASGELKEQASTIRREANKLQVKAAVFKLQADSMAVGNGALSY